MADAPAALLCPGGEGLIVFRPPGVGTGTFKSMRRCLITSHETQP